MGKRQANISFPLSVCSVLVWVRTLFLKCKMFLRNSNPQIPPLSTRLLSFPTITKLCIFSESLRKALYKQRYLGLFPESCVIKLEKILFLNVHYNEELSSECAWAWHGHQHPLKAYRCNCKHSVLVQESLHILPRHRISSDTTPTIVIYKVDFYIFYCSVSDPISS